jgi:hypothetical protein
MQAGRRIGGERSEERLPAALMPMERTTRSVTGRQWKVIGIGQGAGGLDRQLSKIPKHSHQAGSTSASGRGIPYWAHSTDC